MKQIKFNIPSEITLAGSTIKIKYDESLQNHETLGMWVSSKNEILLDPTVPDSVQFRTLMHEIAEVINSLFVNSPESGRGTTHEIVDAFGIGFFNFLIENAGRIIRLE